MTVTIYIFHLTYIVIIKTPKRLLEICTYVYIRFKFFKNILGSYLIQLYSNYKNKSLVLSTCTIIVYQMLTRIA